MTRFGRSPRTLTEIFCEAAVRARPEEISRLRELHRLLKEAYQKKDLTSYFEANRSFHRFIAEVAGSERLYRMIDQMRQEIQKTRWRPFRQYWSRRNRVDFPCSTSRAFSLHRFFLPFFSRRFRRQTLPAQNKVEDIASSQDADEHSLIQHRKGADAMAAQQFHRG